MDPSINMADPSVGEAPASSQGKPTGQTKIKELEDDSATSSSPKAPPAAHDVSSGGGSDSDNGNEASKSIAVTKCEPKALPPQSDGENKVHTNGITVLSSDEKNNEPAHKTENMHDDKKLAVCQETLTSVENDVTTVVPHATEPNVEFEQPKTDILGTTEEIPSQEPIIGRLLEQTKVLPSGDIIPLPGQVVEYKGAEGRLPPRWSIHWHTRNDTDNVIIQQDQWMSTDLETPPTGALQWALDHVQARYQQHIQHALESDPLVPTLFLYAALEEALQTNLQQQQHQTEDQNTKAIGKQDPHPPLYYTTNPSTYLKPPTATDTSPTSTDTKVIMTPASLANRVRLGCQWAHRYVVAQMPPPPAPMANQRRSLRQPKPSPGPIVARPTPVQPGGRVAMWWLSKLESVEEEDQEEEEKEQENEEENHLATPEQAPIEPQQDETTKAKISKNHSNKDSLQDKAEDYMAVDEEEEDEEDTNKQDDDEDYGSKDAVIDEEHELDEELESVEQERRGNLSPVPDEPKNDVNVGVGAETAMEEKEEDLHHSITFQNPYLKPSKVSFLEYLARPKALTVEDVQKAMFDVIMRIKFKKRSAVVGLQTESITTVDQFVLDQETPDYPPGKVVLKCVSDESFNELQKMEAQTFSRCKFILDVIGDEESSLQVQRKQELLQQEIQFKEQKAWSKWRHKGIHEGYSTWPSWHDAIAEWVQRNCTVATSESESAPADTLTTQDDEALAKSLDENEGGRRRTARRAAATASDGVYYGNQSSLTQKNLMDALIRLVKNNQFMTLIRLQALVGDDSNDPIRRTRVALGKLVWKRNLLLRKAIDSEMSDTHLIKAVSKKALLSIAPSAAEKNKVITEEENNESQSHEPSTDEQALINYIQSLHATELYLRRLVTKHLAAIPVAIIATAADERPGSMESMDAADFDDPSSMEWHTSGHDLLKKVIFRPASTYGNSTDMTPCFWYEIQDYAKSIESDADDKDELESKERRLRFRAVPIPPPGESWAEQEQILILTEAQVHAGMKAADMEKKNRASSATDGNPFSGASGDKITLIPVDVDDRGKTAEIHGMIVGYDNVILDDDDEIEYRILVLPESGDSNEAFWASLDVRADTASYVCQPIASSSWYSVEQFDYHQSSEAYQQCESFLNWLGRQNKAAPFADPVDPVALNIPSYPDVVKNPMDISTMRDKLENGQYSSILPGQTIGISPVAKMLNGPFRKDLELIFDNAMLFNAPHDWIYQAASQLKRNALKKIADLSQTADQKLSGGGRFRQKRSVYVDEDSDADLYEPNDSENDDDFDGGSKRKRKRGSSRSGTQKDEFAARAIENAIRLQSTLRDNADLRGPFANLPINLSAHSFSLSPQWSCRLTAAAEKMETLEDSGPAKKRAQEMAELLELQKVVEASETSALRRSTRAHDSTETNGRDTKSKGGVPIEYFTKYQHSDVPLNKLPSNRFEVEVQAEKLHEDYYAKLYQIYSNAIVTNSDNEGAFGVYSSGSFPPYLGRVVPISSWDEVSWEIRSPFVVPALRWVLRGLIQSGHLTAISEMTADFSSGVVMTNDIYYWDATLQPFEVLDLRELQRKKRATRLDEEDSEEEIEMSEYEKARAARVARNAERLKALGLA